MRHYTYTTTTDLSADRLYQAITAIERWPEWDHDLEWTRLTGEARTGAGFTLKPKGGPKVAMTVTAMERPKRFSDLARLPLASMYTDHRFETRGDLTAITVEIGISGPLTFLWDRIAARKQAAGAAVQTAAFIAFARGLS